MLICSYLLIIYSLCQAILNCFLPTGTECLIMLAGDLMETFKENESKWISVSHRFDSHFRDTAYVILVWVVLSNLHLRVKNTAIAFSYKCG